jgi:hypothetical protein
MKIEEIIELYRIANSKEWKPWDLQTELKKRCDRIISVGDDLSFTLKLDHDLRNVDLEKFGGKKTRIYPFKNAYRFETGFVAFEKNFLRISVKIDEKLLAEILRSILPEDRVCSGAFSESQQTSP